MVNENNQLQFFNQPEGYVEPTVTSSGVKMNYVYQYKDHLGNIRLSYTDRDKDGKVDLVRNGVDIDSDNDFVNDLVEENNYYPFGLKHKGYNNNINGRHHKYMFGGKELQDDDLSGSSLDWYDITARNYDPALGRWMNLDPLAEKMRRHSPYNYAFDNPVFFIDPDGMAPDDVILTGSKKQRQKAFNELQASVSSELKLSKDDKGKVTYTQVDSKSTLSSDAKQLVNAIDDHSVTVKVDAQSDNLNSDGTLRIGGSFMGNEVKGDGTVVANQEINPNVLSKMSNANNKPGADVLHEVTEAFQGAKISQKTGISSPRSGLSGTVYKKAHNAATRQSGKVREIVTLKSGVQMPSSIYLDKVTGATNYPKGIKAARWESNGVTIQRYE